MSKKITEARREEFLEQLQRAGLPPPEPEYRFHPVRRWRFDFAWPEHKLCLEVEGGVWTRGRHVRPSGFVKDMEKYNEAVARGWRGPLRVQPKDLSSPDTITLIAKAMDYINTYKN